MATVVPEQVVASVTGAPAAPRTWSFVNRHTGRLESVTCMVGCTINHDREIGATVFPEDIWCWFWSEGLSLPVNECGTPEEFKVLDTVIKVEPWSPSIAQRLPYAVVELVDDHFIDGLDPDGLATVIRTLSERVEAMRETHARLVAVRAEYMGRQARS